MLDHGAARKTDCSEKEQVLYIGIEMSKKWLRLAVSTGLTHKPRVVSVPARDPNAFRRAVEKSRSLLKVAKDARVVTCHEAGRDGFSMHRVIESLGYESYVVDAASIECSSRRRKPKTDRLDTITLFRKLVAYEQGDKNVFRVAVAPSDEDEDRRRMTRELKRLTGERKQHITRMKALLAVHGVVAEITKDFLNHLKRVKRMDRTPIPPHAANELRREYARLKLLDEQIAEVKGELCRAAKEAADRTNQVVIKLAALCGIGLKGATILAHEALGWRTFSNRKKAGAFTGMVNAPYDTGDSRRDQGITKAGNAEVRWILVELAWSWVRHQPDSVITKWFNERFAKGSSRQRRIGIVAVARKLFVALWRYTDQGVLPEGARLKERVVLR